MLKRLAVVALVLMASDAGTLAQGSGADRDQIACEPDVHRLCEEVFPDVERVATCLVTKRQQLSTPCATALAHPTADAPDEK